MKNNNIKHNNKVIKHSLIFEIRKMLVQFR